MRILLALFAVTSLLAMSACEDGNNPNNIPRTVPPASVDSAATVQLVKGAGPKIWI